MTSLAIDATNRLADLTEPFWTKTIIMAIAMAVILAGFALICEISAMVVRFGKKRKPNADSPSEADLFLLDVVFMMFGLFAVVVVSAINGSYSDYVASPHVNVNRMVTKSLTYDLKISKSGAVVSSTSAKDKSGMTNLKVVDTHGNIETVKISKNRIDAVYNSDAKPTLTVEKVTDKATNKSYYVAQKLVLNNQPIQYK